VLSAIVSADSIQWVSIIVKAAAYAATLLAAGSVLILLTLRTLSVADRCVVRNVGLAAAFMAVIVSVARIPIQASFLTGGTLTGPMLLTMVAESPLGSSIAIRVVGLGI